MPLVTDTGTIPSGSTGAKRFAVWRTAKEGVANTAISFPCASAGSLVK